MISAPCPLEIASFYQRVCEACTAFESRLLPACRQFSGSGGVVPDAQWYGGEPDVAFETEDENARTVPYDAGEVHLAVRISVSFRLIASRVAAAREATCYRQCDFRLAALTGGTELTAGCRT